MPAEMQKRVATQAWPGSNSEANTESPAKTYEGGRATRSMASEERVAAEASNTAAADGSLPGDCFCRPRRRRR